MSKFKLYYGGQVFKMAGLVVKEMPPEKDVLIYTYEDGIYTMSISNPSRTTLRLLEQGNLVLAASVRDIANPDAMARTGLETVDENGDMVYYPSVRERYHPRYFVVSYSPKNNRVFINDLSNFTFDESSLVPPKGISNLLTLSQAEGHEPIDDGITTQYKFVLRNGRTGRVYKSYRKTDGYHPITFY